jgi:hypothetical protein
VQERLTRAPFAASNARTEKIRRRGLTFLLDWLEAQPNGGATRGCPTDLFTQNKSQAAQDFYYRPSTIRRSRNAAACIPFVG